MADKKTTTKKTSTVKIKDLAPSKDAVGGADELNQTGGVITTTNADKFNRTGSTVKVR